MGGGKDRHVIQMIANASLDIVEDVMRKDNAMYVFCFRLLFELWVLSLEALATVF